MSKSMLPTLGEGIIVAALPTEHASLGNGESPLAMADCLMIVDTLRVIPGNIAPKRQSLRWYIERSNTSKDEKQNTMVFSHSPTITTLNLSHSITPLQPKHLPAPSLDVLKLHPVHPAPSHVHH